MPKNLPKVDAFKKIFEIADQSSKALMYARDRLVEITASARKSTEMKPVITQLEALAKLMEGAIPDSAALWRGKEEFKVPNATSAIQEQIGLKASEHLKSANVTTVQHHISIKENGEYERAFTSSDGKLDEEQIKALDESFNDWLAQQGVISKSSTLYKQDSKGEMALDSKGKPIKADVAKIENLLSDPKKGFAALMEQRGITVDIKIREPAAEAQGPSTNR